MTNSILLTVKKMLGIAEEYHAFDLDIIININSVFLTLNQLGVGPIQPYKITGEEENWDDFQGESPIPGVETYVYLKTRLLFDPPTNSFLVDNIQKQIAELEWRMNVQVETPPSSLISEPINPDLPEVSIFSAKSKKFSTKTVSSAASSFQQKIISTLNTKSSVKGG